MRQWQISPREEHLRTGLAFWPLYYYYYCYYLHKTPFPPKQAPGKSHVIDTSGTMLAVPYSAWGENYGRLVSFRRSVPRRCVKILTSLRGSTQDTGHHEVRDGLDRRSKEADATAIGGYRWTQSPQSSRSSSWKLYVRI